MNDLISREQTKKAIQNYFIGLNEKGIYEVDVVDCNAELYHEVISEIPNAYNVNKVVEQLAKRFDFCQEMAEKNDKAKLEKMAFSWRQVANGVMDAIDIVKGAVKVNDCKYALEIMNQELSNKFISPEIIYAFATCIEALEKQIPKKPITHDKTNRADCPICEVTVRGINKPYGDYCSECGQKLDWSVEDE